MAINQDDLNRKPERSSLLAPTEPVMPALLVSIHSVPRGKWVCVRRPPGERTTSSPCCQSVGRLSR